MHFYRGSTVIVTLALRWQCVPFGSASVEKATSMCRQPPCKISVLGFQLRPDRAVQSVGPFREVCVGALPCDGAAAPLRTVPHGAANGAARCRESIQHLESTMPHGAALFIDKKKLTFFFFFFHLLRHRAAPLIPSVESTCGTVRHRSRHRAAPSRGTVRHRAAPCGTVRNGAAAPSRGTVARHRRAAPSRGTVARHCTVRHRRAAPSRGTVARHRRAAP